MLHLGVPGYGVSDDKMKGLHTSDSTDVNRITSSKIRIIRILLDFNRVAYFNLKCSANGRYSATYMQKEKVTTGINFPLKYQGSNKDLSQYFQIFPMSRITPMGTGISIVITNEDSTAKLVMPWLQRRELVCSGLTRLTSSHSPTQRKVSTTFSLQF